MIQFSIETLLNQYAFLGLPVVILVFASVMARFDIKG